MQEAVFAAGCFWGVQDYFDQIPGVVRTEAGYTGGHTEHPTYDDVVSHNNGHAEALKVWFNPDEVSYETLVRQFFRMHDPTQLNRQGPDVGENYRSAIFYADDGQQQIAAEVLDELNSTKFAGKIATVIEPVHPWWPAEEYHQKFVQKTGRGACHMPYKPL